MEVHSSFEVLKANFSKNCNKNREPAENRFGAILDETIADTSKTDTGALKTPMVDKMQGIAFYPSLSMEENPIIEQTEKLLDTLDNYREKLQNPDVGLEEFYPLISEMEMRKEGLASALKSLPEGDGLKDILNEAMVISSVEVAKFNRGDYRVEMSK